MQSKSTKTLTPNTDIPLQFQWETILTGLATQKNKNWIFRL